MDGKAGGIKNTGDSRSHHPVLKMKLHFLDRNKYTKKIWKIKQTKI